MLLYFTDVAYFKNYYFYYFHTFSHKHTSVRAHYSYAYTMAAAVMVLRLHHGRGGHPGDFPLAKIGPLLKKHCSNVEHY